MSLRGLRDKTGKTIEEKEKLEVWVKMTSLDLRKKCKKLVDEAGKKT